MPHMDGWHYVRPTTTVTTSIMIAGKPWDREIPPHDAGKNSPLKPERIQELLAYFLKQLHSRKA